MTGMLWSPVVGCWIKKGQVRLDCGLDGLAVLSDGGRAD